MYLAFFLIIIVLLIFLVINSNQNITVIRDRVLDYSWIYPYNWSGEWSYWPITTRFSYSHRPINRPNIRPIQNRPIQHRPIQNRPIQHRPLGGMGHGRR
jgi:hypothetical protein